MHFHPTHLKGIGELLALLEARGQLDNTWIVYCSDHGEMLGDHGLMAKMNFYRSSVRVPLIVRPPTGAGARAGAVESAPVQAFDVAATLLDAADAASLNGAPARSLLPFVTGDADAERDAAPHDWAISMIRMRPGTPTWQAITDGQWRATFNADTGEASELFDLGADPDEATNLVGEPAASEMLGALHDQLTSRLETV